MCELLGMTANVPTDICFSFTGLIQRSGVTGQHCDGWGITFYEGKGTRTFKDTTPGVQSEVAKLVEHYPIKSCLVISHIRKANRGKVCLENTHPFDRELWGENWTYAHNGQLRSIKQQATKCYYPIGTTDSEHAFCLLLDRLRTKYRKSPKRNRLFWFFMEKQLKEFSKTGVFNVLISDAKYLYAYSSKSLYWITRKAPFGKARLIDKEMTIDFNKVTSNKDIVTVIATQPLTDNESWHKIQKNTLYVFCKGLLVHPSIKSYKDA